MRLLVLLALTMFALGQEAEPLPAWTVLRYDPFQVAPNEADSDAEALIDRLTDLAKPRPGLSSHPNIDTHLAPTTDPFGRLIRMGPAALPAVLKHLDDGRKTKLTFEDSESGFGGLLVSRGLPVPLGRATEMARIRAAIGNAVAIDWIGGGWGVDPELGPDIGAYTVTVGDCCFSILGQIVNRPYQAVRHRPTLITAVCSPTLEPRIAKAMRAVWGDGDPRKILAKSLQDDFHTRGADSSELQAGAAARLCVYFPEQAGPLVAGRVDRLRFSETDGIDAGDLLREVLRTHNASAREAWLRLLDPARPREVLLTALDALDRPPEQGAKERIRVILEKTDDAAVMLACLEWLPLGGDGLFERLQRTLEQAEARGVEGYRDCQGLIEVMIRLDRDRAFRICRGRVDGDHERRLIVLGALFWARDPVLSRALLVPLLEDTSPLGRMGGIPMPASFCNVDRRVCDYAAVVLARSIEGLVFADDPDSKKRDAEIAAMRAKLAK